jgi:hypothetical protein
MKTNATRETVVKAIENVNKKQGYQIELNRNDQTGKWFNFTLKSKSGVSGSRYSGSGRKLACASWHAHGYVFDAIFEIEPKAVILSLGEKITIDGGNWQDKNVGSMVAPCYFSQTSIL